MMMAQSDLKICPTCGAQSFMDAPLCFGCLQEFDEPERLSSSSDDDLVAVGVVMVKKEGASEGALEITLRFDDRYAKDFAKLMSCAKVPK